jgi:hypothetical protein
MLATDGVLSLALAGGHDQVGLDLLDGLAAARRRSQSSDLQ